MGVRESVLVVSVPSSRVTIFRKDELLINVLSTEEFAFLEASYTIVRLLQTFKNIELIDEKTVDQRDHPKHTVTLVVASANGCKVRLTP